MKLSSRSLRSARSLITSTALAAAAVAGAGCQFQVEGKTDPDAVPVKFEGTERTQEVVYGPNQRLRIDSVNGAVDVTVNNSDKVKVTFRPFAFARRDSESDAVAVMEKNLRLVMSAEGEEIKIQALKDGGSGSFGADIIVSVPASFSGDFKVTQGNGSVDVDLGGSAFDDVLDVATDNGGASVNLDGTKPAATIISSTGAGDVDVVGAGGRLAIAGEFDVNVDIDRWSGEDGFVRASDQLGSVFLKLNYETDGVLVVSSPSIIEPAPFPEAWSKEADATGAVTYTLGKGSGGTVDVQAPESVSLQLK